MPYRTNMSVHVPGWRTAPEAATFQSWQLCAGFDWAGAVVRLLPRTLAVAFPQEACHTQEAVVAVKAEGIGSEVDREAVVAR